jgi:hypothetical protein
MIVVTSPTRHIGSQVVQNAANETVRVIARKPDRIFEFGPPGDEDSPCRYARDMHRAEDLSFDDMAAIMTDVLGSPIRFQSVPGEAYKAQLMKLGASEAYAQSLVNRSHASRFIGP